MESGSNLNFEFNSHQNKLLEKHLEETAKYSEIIAHGLGNTKIVQNLGVNTIQKLVLIMGLFHDIAKATKSFNDYLAGRIDKSPYNHSFLSALIGQAAADLELQNIERKELLKFLPYLSISRHHSSIHNIEEVTDTSSEYGRLSRPVKKDFDEKLKNEVIENIRNYFLSFYEKKGIKNIEDIINKDYEKEIKELENEIGKIEQEAKKIKLIDWFQIIRLLSSVLFTADIYSAAELIKDEDYTHNIYISEYKIDKDLVKEYYINEYRNKDFVRDYSKNTKNEYSDINKMRNIIFDLIEKEGDNINPDNHIIKIKLQTGVGKTLIGLNLAIKLKDRFNLDRIIYSLPFLSISDQVESEIDKILEGKDDIKKYVTRYDHLSYKENDNENFEERLNAIYETWSDKIIITTFVALFNVILGNDKKSITKFRTLSNSVIIIDEMQALPAEYYDLIEKNIKWLGDNLNSYFIIMSATDPGIISDDESLDITKKIEQKFEEEFKNPLKLTLNRYKIYLYNNLREMYIEDLANEIINKKENKRIGVILNTIRSSVELYDILKKECKYTEIYYLSSELTPVDKKAIIDKLTKDKIKNLILVSTQVIEAGVDISFDIIYRDLAPLDAIIQSAGRCNRSGFSDPIGEVILTKLKDENGKFYANMIYRSNLLELTEDFLKDSIDSAKNCYIKEIDINNRIKEYYFKKVRESINTNKDNMIEKEEELRFYDINKSFNLIEKNKNKTSVLILKEKNKEKIKEIIKEIKEANNITDKSKKFKKIYNISKCYKELSQYIAETSIEESKFEDPNPEAFKKIGIDISEKELKSLSNFEIKVFTEDNASLVYDEVGLHDSGRILD